MYDYTRQTDEEVSFSEDTELDVYDTSDPDWTLVGVNSDFGFAPSNYIEIVEDAAAQPPSLSLPQRPVEQPDEEPDEEPASSAPARAPPAAAIANILQQQQHYQEEMEPPPPPKPARPTYYPESHDNESESPPPSLPRRPAAQRVSTAVESTSPSIVSPRQASQLSADSDGVRESPPYNRIGEPQPRSASAYHIYNVNEMIEVMGKRKKFPTTLGINIATGIIFLSPEGADRQQEWTGEKLAYYSMEGKHVFLDLVRPSKSVDLHAGAKDTAKEIVRALGEISGTYKAEGLREVIEAGAGTGAHKTGQVLYDFMAQGDDEVSVAAGDDVVVLDDEKSDDWWMVQRVKNGREGVVPSSYVEVTGIIPNNQPHHHHQHQHHQHQQQQQPQPQHKPTSAGVDLSLTPVERNRLEEARITKASSLKVRRDSRGSDGRNKSKPDPMQTRQWTDRTRTFTVDAQFIGLHDGKIHLHKVNGVKIAVPIAKMSTEDLEYVERVTGVSLDEDKPLSDMQKNMRNGGKAGATVEPPKQPEYDWFDFFLKAGVGPYQCERYSQNFNRDSMDESILPDITPDTLRTLGLKEGDILRVMRYLDNVYNRTGSKSSGGKMRNVSFGGEEVISNGEGGSSGGLFAGPGGALHNNTRKSRPAPAVQTNDTVDSKVFEQLDSAERRSPTAAASEKPAERGFDDDAWEVKQPKKATTPSSPSRPITTAATTTAAPPQKSLSGALADLSVLHPPLQPAPAHPTGPTPMTSVTPAPPVQPLQPMQTAVQNPQQTGATPGFFAQVAQQQQPQIQAQATGMQGFQPQSLTSPQTTFLSAPAPPQRPFSAPQNLVPQPTGFGAPPLQPQLTGFPQARPSVPPTGQSLADVSQQRFQPQPTGFQPQPTGFGASPLQPQLTGFPQSRPSIPPTGQSLANLSEQRFLQPQPTGFSSMQNGFQAPQPTGFGQPQAAPTALNGQITAQPTGFAIARVQQPMQTGVFSPPPPTTLQPQRTAVNGGGGMASFTGSPPPPPPIPQQPTATPLLPQKTGSAPPVRFGVKPNSPNKLTAQPTGLRANLAQASKLSIHLPFFLMLILENLQRLRTHLVFSRFHFTYSCTRCV